MPGPGDRGFIYLGTESPDQTIVWDDKGAREASLQPATQRTAEPSLSGPVPSYGVAGRGMGGTHPEVAIARANHVAAQAPKAPDYEALIHALEQQALKDEASLRAPGYVTSMPANGRQFSK